MKIRFLRFFIRFMVCYLAWTVVTLFLVIDWFLGNFPRGPGFDTRIDEVILKYLVFLPRHGPHAVCFWINGLVWALGLSLLWGAIRSVAKMARNRFLPNQQGGGRRPPCARASTSHPAPGQ